MTRVQNAILKWVALFIGFWAVGMYWMDLFQYPPSRLLPGYVLLATPFCLVARRLFLSASSKRASSDL